MKRRELIALLAGLAVADTRRLAEPAAGVLWALLLVVAFGHGGDAHRLDLLLN
jgi:hypothetical protein